MKSLWTRPVSLLLVLLMLIPLAACGTGNQPLEDTTDNASQAPNEEVVTQDPNYICDLPVDLDYDTEVQIMYVNKGGRGDELESEKLGNGLISDAVYERNLVTEERLGITLGYSTRGDDSEAVSTIANLVQAGDDTVDIFILGAYQCMTPTLAGHYQNLNQVENIDLTKHYWSQDFNEMMTFTSNNLQFVSTSPLAISLFRRGYLTMFNRDLFQDHKIPDLYETVNNGEWTLEYQYQIVKDIYVDADGDGKESVDDFYGFAVGAVTDMDVYAVAANIHIVTRDEEGAMIYNESVVDKIVDLGEKVSMLTNAQGTNLLDSYVEGFDAPIMKFAEEKALMATMMFGSIEGYFEYFADMNYGIAPIPKLTKDQEGYGTYIQDQVSTFGISASIGDEERQAILGATLEALSYYSYEIIRPAYYDAVLSLRFMQDPQSREILDMMFKSISFDYVYLTDLSGIRGTMRTLLSSSNPAMGSTVTKWKKQVETDLRNLQRTLERNLNR